MVNEFGNIMKTIRKFSCHCGDDKEMPKKQIEHTTNNSTVHTRDTATKWQ